MSQTVTTPSLVVDVGGTNTRVALSEDGKVRMETIKRFRNAEFDGLELVLQEYLAAQSDVHVQAACVAIAGPVRDGQGHLTNRNWQMNETSLGEAMDTPQVTLLNDLQAQGYALDHVADEDLLQPRTGPSCISRISMATRRCLVATVSSGV